MGIGSVGFEGEVSGFAVTLLLVGVEGLATSFFFLEGFRGLTPPLVSSETVGFPPSSAPATSVLSSGGVEGLAGSVSVFPSGRFGGALAVSDFFLEDDEGLALLAFFPGEEGLAVSATFASSGEGLEKSVVCVATEAVDSFGSSEGRGVPLSSACVLVVSVVCTEAGVVSGRFFFGALCVFRAKKQFRKRPSKFGSTRSIRISNPLGSK
mmetsp:Transcript_42008/g.50924  ORF Transcript_42008/g.50924 Transcript_42008/m.50924 type:complete len:209 (-) Transcript_42008:377-1003(-)